MDFKKLFKLAKEKGIEDIQIAYSSETSKEIEYTDNELSAFTINTNTHFSAKGIYNSKMGTYSTEVVDESEFETIVDKIIESAKYITNEDEVFIYEGDKHYETIKNEFNESLNSIDIKDKIKLVEDLSIILLKKDYATHTDCGYSETEAYSMMMNSKGFEIKSHSNGFQVFASVVVSKDGDTRNNYSLYTSNDFSSIDKDFIINDAYDFAYKSLGAKPIKSGQYEVIFNESSTGTLVNVFSGMFSSDSNQKGLSILKDRVGEKIGSDVVTIVDNPLLENSLSSTNCDTDGVATRYKEVVKDGVFTGFVYNLKTAKKENTKSTGNALGSGCGLFIPYFKPGLRTLNEMIKDTKHGIFITELMGAHAGANEMSCDFSLQASGFEIVDGKLANPIALITVSDNYLNMLKHITEVSKDIKNSFDSTAIRVDKISVSGV